MEQPHRVICEAVCISGSDMTGQEYQMADSIEFFGRFWEYDERVISLPGERERHEYNMISELQVGVITQTHGIKGEVKVFPTTDDAGRFKKLKEVIMDTGRERLNLEIEGVKFFKQYVIVKFKGYDSINDIEKYKSAKLYVTREQAVKLKKDEYFIADLIGLNVVTDEGEQLGSMKDVMTTGANDVYVVERGDGTEVLLPAIRECVKNIDMEKQQITVHIMDGLL